MEPVNNNSRGGAGSVSTSPRAGCLRDLAPARNESGQWQRCIFCCREGGFGIQFRSLPALLDPPTAPPSSSRGIINVNSDMGPAQWSPACAHGVTMSSHFDCNLGATSAQPGWTPLSAASPPSALAAIMTQPGMAPYSPRNLQSLLPGQSRYEYAGLVEGYGVLPTERAPVSCPPRGNGVSGKVRTGGGAGWEAGIFREPCRTLSALTTWGRLRTGEPALLFCDG